MVMAAPPIRKIRVGGRSRRPAGFRRWKTPVRASTHRGLAARDYDSAPVNVDGMSLYRGYFAPNGVDPSGMCDGFLDCALASAAAVLTVAKAPGEILGYGGAHIVDVAIATGYGAKNAAYQLTGLGSYTFAEDVPLWGPLAQQQVRDMQAGRIGSMLTMPVENLTLAAKANPIYGAASGLEGMYNGLTNGDIDQFSNGFGNAFVSLSTPFGLRAPNGGAIPVRVAPFEIESSRTCPTGIKIQGTNGKFGTGVGYLDRKTGDIRVTLYENAGNKGLGTDLLALLINKVGEKGPHRTVSGQMAGDNWFAFKDKGPEATPFVKSLSKLGYQIDRVDNSTQFIWMRRVGE
jgi:hypothetical protein